MKRILVIEDNVEERQMFVTALKDAGYEVIEAPEGASGIRIFHETPCDFQC